MALKDAVRNVMETVVSPSLAELGQRLEAARTALLAAQEADSAAQAVLDTSYGAGDDRAAQKAQADRVQARLAMERAGGRVAALERQLQAVETAEAERQQAADRQRLAHHVEARGELGAQILSALAALEGAVKAFRVNEAAILALPDSIRGHSAVAGYNIGSGPLQTHLRMELEQRGVTGQPSSVERPRLADWLRTGSGALGS